MNMKSLSTYIKFGIPGIIVGGVVATGFQFVLAWTAPTGAPPSNNTPTPLNVSATNQTKAGSLILPSVVDYNDGTYTVDPNGVSYLNDVRSNIYYDKQNTGYYVDPNNTSNMAYSLIQGYIQSPLYYDLNNTAFYVDPAGTNAFTNTYNYGYIQSTADNWGLLTYGPGWSANSAPQSYVGSVYTNDVYLRSIGKWASQLNGKAPCPQGTPPNYFALSHGQMFAYDNPGNGYGVTLYLCLDGSISSVNMLYNSPAPTCFPKDTPVLMASGEYKAIDKIKTGEKVMGMNGSTNTVRGLWRPKLNDRTLYSVNGDFMTTGDHMILAMRDGKLSWGSIEPALYKERRYMKPAVVQDSTGGKLLISNSNIAPEALMKLSEGASLIDYRGDTVTLNSLEKVAGTSPDDQLYTLYTDNTGSFVVNGGYVVDGMPQRPLSEVLEDSDSQKQ